MKQILHDIFLKIPIRIAFAQFESKLKKVNIEP